MRRSRQPADCRGGWLASFQHAGSQERGRRVLEVLDAAAGRRWYRSGLAALEATCAEINSLHVLPVADADTGTNLLMTLGGAEPDDVPTVVGADLAQLVTSMARRCLLGARGGSGVILSQLLRGVAEV